MTANSLCSVIAGRKPPPIDVLAIDMLVSIADKLVSEPSDIRNLRLVDKRFNSAVGQSSIVLRPHKALTSGQLLKLSHMFRNTTSLDLSRCQLLGNECLRGFNTYFPRLEYLNLEECSWLSAAGVAHLGSLLNLANLSLCQCSSLLDLPHNTSGLVSLRFLSLQNCRMLRSLQEGISGLTSLQYLSLGNCTALEGLPEAIGALSMLQHMLLPFGR